MSYDYSTLTTVYSKRKHGNEYLTNNFQVKEFGCNDGSDAIAINLLLPLICQIVRNWSGKPLSPSSAYRTVAYNARPEVGGATNSNHIYGNAVDIPTPAGKTAKELYDFLDMILGNFGELIIYSWGCHVGIQNEKKRLVDKSYTGG